jgi:hypothetical protein
MPLFEMSAELSIISKISNLRESEKMSDEGKPLQPEHQFKKIIWRSTLAVSGSIEQFTTWTMTGITAIVGLVVSNVDSVAKIVSLEALKSSIILFTLSLLAGVVSKQLGMTVSNGIRTMNELEGVLNSDNGRLLINNMTIDLRQLMQEVSTPFFWPLSAIMRRSGENGITDYLSADKMFVRLFFIQLCFNAFHGLFAAAALITIAWSI